MIRRYLGEYKNFQCVANACKDTCCSGWAIEIDDDSLNHYHKQGGELFHNKVDFEEGIFCQRENGDCAFLREDGLCEMILQCGEGMLCDTCRLYPRHIEEFYGVREYSLSVSCPEVACSVLSMSAYYSFTEEEDDEAEDESLYEDYDQELYDALVMCRSEVLTMIQDKTISFEEKCGNILKYMKAKQFSLYEDEEEPYEVPAFYHAKNFEWLFSLEPIAKYWTETITRAKYILFGTKEHPIPANMTEAMIRAFDSAHPKWQRQCENLLYYFIFTYMCGAVYDDYVYAMAAQAVYNTLMVKLLWVAKYEENQRALSVEEQADLLYKYSRELENSVENVILLEQLLDEKF